MRESANLDRLSEVDGIASRTRHHPYPEYKPSAAEWIPNIPTSWNIKRLRYALSFPTKSEIRNLPGETPVSFVPMESVGEYGGLTLDTVRQLNTVNNGFTYFRDGDVLVAKITPCFENGKGAIARDLESGVGFGTTELHVLRPGPELNARFLFYVTIGREFRELGTAEMYGAGGQKRVPEAFIRELRHPLPPLPEQQTIADFLDRETAKIDGLVAKKRRLIELLEEKRTALISHAVTKGLDPNVPMKDSGIEWVGKVPHHWEVKKVKHLTRILRGKFTHRPRNDPRMYDGPYPFIQTGNVAAANKYVREYHQTLSEDGFKVSKQFPKGTLLMTIAANIGDIAILDFEACFPDSIVGFVPLKGIALDFLYNLFIAMRPALFETATLNTQLNLNIERIGGLLTVCPPREEQSRIADHVDATLSRFAELRTRIETAIEKLLEYRTALISAAVTGKIDVRNAS